MSMAAAKITRSSPRGDEYLYDHRYTAMACQIWQHNLKARGWKYKKNPLGTWMFIPPSLVGASGERGVHYACEYGELGRMLERFGLDYDPKDLDDRLPELPDCEKKSLQCLHAELFPNGVPMTTSRKKARTADPPTPPSVAAPAAVSSMPTPSLMSRENAVDFTGSPEVRERDDPNLCTPQASVIPMATTQKDKYEKVGSNNILEKLELARQYHEMVEYLFGDKLAAARACPEFKIFLNNQELDELESEDCIRPF